MPIITVKLSHPLERSFRTEQVAGLFDLPSEQFAHTLTAKLPALDEDWTIGAIVGPSGSGKTTLARAAFGDAIAQPKPWPADRAVIDALGERPLKDLLRLLTAVGLSSPPSWLRPYRTLSTGERFRADLARALLEIKNGLLVLDEFTSPLDRTTAHTASAALAKLLRKNPQSDIPNPKCTPPKFIALTCHADILPWLAPDWVLDLGADPPQLARGSLRRPPVVLAVRRAPQSLWPRFARHHYLSGGLSTAARCYAAFYCDRPVAFCAALATLGWKRTKRITRLVVLPQFQGLGVGPRLAEIVAEQEASEGNRVTLTASHPAMVGHCGASPRWRYVGLKKTGSTPQRLGERTIRSSAGRAVASFEYVPRTLATEKQR